MRLHPAAKLYPPLATPEAAELEASILEHGIQTPVLTWRGQIIDGAHRAQIAAKHNLPLPTTELDHAANPWTAALAANAARRHLTPTERAIIATRATIASQTRPDQLPDTPKSTRTARARSHELTMAQAAAATGARRQTMSAVRTTLTRGTTDTIAALTEAELPADLTAQIARLPGPAQHEALTAAKLERAPQPRPPNHIPGRHRKRYQYVIAYPPYPATPGRRPHYGHTATLTARQIADYPWRTLRAPNGTIAIHAPPQHLATAHQIYEQIAPNPPRIIAQHHHGAPPGYWLLDRSPEHLTDIHCTPASQLPNWLWNGYAEQEMHGRSGPHPHEAIILWPPPELPLPFPHEPIPDPWTDHLPAGYTHHTPGDQWNQH